ncbi:hypothetical protein BV911_09775 [Pseudoruegeria sp. SK021]|nr:hypothetical protein BV911_09775 [Pseudoruegeria sp. SK021]
MRAVVCGLTAALTTTAAFAEPATYTIDPSHSQAIFTYNHIGFSNTSGMVSGFEGDIQLDAENPANSAVSVTIPMSAFTTGWDARDEHFLTTGEFFTPDATVISFQSTGVEVTGDTTALITGDLTLNDITKEIVLDAVLNSTGEYPFPPYAGRPAAGFDATTTVLRSDFGLGLYAPYISDEITVKISLEAMQIEDPA